MSGYLIEKAGLQKGDMEKINRFTRRKFSEEEIYSFSLVLCDNEVDRDFDRFSVAALHQLKELFVGKTCIFDHERKSANQTARIYHTEIAQEAKRTADAEPYTKLVARAYLPLTEQSREMITAIESGILKEVSISCAVEKSRCAVCGKAACGHRKGESYAGKSCHRVFESISDAYECSFVAVPAQRAAGVTKRFHGADREKYEQGEVRNLEEILKSIRSAEQEIVMSKENAVKLAGYLQELEEKQMWGEQYRAELSRQVMKCSALVQPEMPRAVMESTVQTLSIQDLKTMAAVYGKMAEKQMPIKPQLWSGQAAKKAVGDDEFKI